jgi:hypothetical protein
MDSDWLPDLFTTEITTATGTITETTTALIASQILLKELHYSDVSLELTLFED